MNVCRFINSKDVAEHLRAAWYQFNAFETVYFVEQFADATLDEKISAWKEIAETMPNCPTAQLHGAPITKSAEVLTAFFTNTLRYSSTCSTNLRIKRASFMRFGACGTHNVQKVTCKTKRTHTERTHELKKSHSSSQRLQIASITYKQSNRMAMVISIDLSHQRPRSISTRVTTPTTMK